MSAEQQDLQVDIRLRRIATAIDQLPTGRQGRLSALTLLDDLETLLAELRATRSRIGEQLGGSLSGQMAATAYGQAAMRRKNK